MPLPSSFELLPDEIILHICQYLRSADILYSLYNLNSRLNVTITGYCRHINLMTVSYKQFEYAVAQVLPQIGSFVRTFVLNGNWETIMNNELSTMLFISPLSTLFPQLQRLIIKWFNSKRLLSFVDTLYDFSQLTELDIRFLKGNPTDSLVKKILSANNSRLAVISFDEDCVDLDISDDTNTISYPNIQEFTINLTLIKFIPCIFLLVPNVSRLHLSIDELSSTSNINMIDVNLSPLIHLIDFQLRSINYFWTFDNIAHILKAMPSLQRFTFDLRTDDKRLFNAEDLLTILPSSLVSINFFIRYYHSELDVEVNKAIHSSSCHILFDERRNRFLIYTIPCDLRSLTLPATISKQMPSGWRYTQQIKNLYVYGITSMLEILLILQHFRHLRILNINIKENSRVCKYLYCQLFSFSLFESILIMLLWCILRSFYFFSLHLHCSSS